MSFLRPEALAALQRWRETLAGAGVAVLGLWLALGGHGLGAVAGGLLAAAGAILGLLGVQRARFRGRSGGPGVVQVVEGQVTYFGPQAGGSVAVRELSRLDLDAGAGGSPAWILSQPGQPPLVIPTDAAGAEALFDAFATLEGIRTERMLHELNRRPDTRVTIWRRARVRLNRRGGTAH